jgi:hypothetical protein
MAKLALLSFQNYLVMVHYKSVTHHPMEHFIFYVVNNTLNNGHPLEFHSNMECGRNPRAPF